MQIQTSIAANPQTVTGLSTTLKGLQIATAFLIGVVILYGAGFAQISTVHNAAHDSRHSQGFPCH